MLHPSGLRVDGFIFEINLPFDTSKHTDSISVVITPVVLDISYSSAGEDT